MLQYQTSTVSFRAGWAWLPFHFNWAHKMARGLMEPWWSMAICCKFYISLDPLMKQVSSWKKTKQRQAGVKPLLLKSIQTMSNQRWCRILFLAHQVTWAQCCRCWWHPSLRDIVCLTLMGEMFLGWCEQAFRQKIAPSVWSLAYTKKW